ncbi:hypothetical protein AOXY_G26091 [Acipenser oxyrinchus oxyrinchus]|uniref:Uncharacterized protein n=1 Tax=Acipenser oxyrinchus oxyrinchus TaxID=40147 RepID=A0AAD8FW31_ACIOX|nr:hypothetical protein AOXY_G26091 [Acipenser oxyrinchus oxyrinchus]
MMKTLTIAVFALLSFHTLASCFLSNKADAQNFSTSPVIIPPVPASLSNNTNLAKASNQTQDTLQIEMYVVVTGQSHEDVLEMILQWVREAFKVRPEDEIYVIDYVSVTYSQ